MKVIQIPLLRDNYGYLIACEESNEAAIVDPSEAEPVLRRVEQEQLKLQAILNTHHHRDHTGGNPRLLERFRARVYGHRLDRERIPGLNHPLDEGDEITIGDLKGKILFVPGHTKGHIAYLFHNALFCGDTLFVAGCGRLFEGTPAEMLSSLERLRSLPPETLVYCGHEYTQKNLEFALTVEPQNKKVADKLERVRPLRAKGLPTVPSTIREEIETNPFLRWESEEIRENLKRKFPDLDPGPVSIFAKVRELKDRF